MCVLHIVIALGHYHHWSHDAAVAETARQTAAVYGLAWGGGVYVNYVFVAVWLAELSYWRARPAAYFARSPIVVWGVRAFFFTVVFNAAAVFAAPRARVAGVAMTVVLLLIWAKRLSIGARSRMP